MLRLFNLVFFLIALAAIPALALAGEEPPARVGRVSFVSGSFAFHTPGQSEWSAAAVNFPVATGTSLWTEPDARAEIRIGPDTIAMSGSTELDIGRLSAIATQLNLSQGRIYLHLRQLNDKATFEIVIPRGGILLLQPGSYDISAGSESQPARIAVFEGSARFTGNGADVQVKAGEVAVLNGFEPVVASIEQATTDAFVDWCRSRNYDEARLAAPYYVSPNMTGYAELDRYGHWDTAPGYGEVWYPAVPAGWTPYSDGRWVWIEPWGWTWIDNAAWGFAPSHYGRWAFVGERWCWVPGSFVALPVYAPALVGFLGGQGIGLYVSGAVGPQIGWFPLAPGEVYWPSYSSDPSYIRALNAASVANIDNIRLPRNRLPPAQIMGAGFANRQFATIVPEHAFTSAGNVRQGALHVPARALEHASATTSAPHLRPPHAQSLPGPARAAARVPSERAIRTQGGYGPSAPPPAVLRAGRGPTAAAGRTVTTTRPTAMHQPSMTRPAGGGPAIAAHGSHGFAAAPHIAHSPPSSAPAAGFSAPPHTPRAAPQPAHLAIGGGHGPPGGGHGPPGGGHAGIAPGGHGPPGGGHGGGGGHGPEGGGGHGGGHHG